MNTADTFFEIPKINSKRYWDTRIEDFRNKTDVSVRERESFFLEFFVSGYLDNKSQISKKLKVPYTDIAFNNPNGDIIARIAKKYNFFDHNELRIVAEGFYHYYLQSKILNDFWAKNYTELSSKPDERYMMLCVFTFLSLSYPASYNSYFGIKSPTKFTLSDNQIKGLGFSGVAALVSCSFAFCTPGTSVPFPWNPHKMDNPLLFWNKNNVNKELAEDFPETLRNFLSSRFSMRHEDYSLFSKLEKPSFPVSFVWIRPQTNVAKQDKEQIHQLLENLQTGVANRDNDPDDQSQSTSDGNSTEPIENIAIEPQIRNLITKACLFFERMVEQIQEDSTADEKSALLKQIYGIQMTLEQLPDSELLPASNRVFDNLDVLLTDIINQYEKITTLKNSRRTTQEQLPEDEHGPSASQLIDSSKITEHSPEIPMTPTFKLLQEQYDKQGKLLRNVMQRNKELQMDLEHMIAPEALRTALAKYFKPESLEKLIQRLTTI